MSRYLVLSAFTLISLGSAANADEKFTSEAGKYTVAFPTKPTESDREIDSKVGKLKMFIATVELKKDVGLIVIYNDYPDAVANEKPQDVLARVRDGSKGTDGKILGEKPITHGIEVGERKKPGLEYLLEKGADHYYRAQIFLDGTRLYQVIVTSAKKDDLTSPAADRFFDSFKIKD